MKKLFIFTLTILMLLGASSVFANGYRGHNGITFSFNSVIVPNSYVYGDIPYERVYEREVIGYTYDNYYPRHHYPRHYRQREFYGYHHRDNYGGRGYYHEDRQYRRPYHNSYRGR